MTEGCQASDATVETPEGPLLARTWTPAGGREACGGAPVVLFHDSLGSVELWRTFPERLCEATSRVVVAYDRLGFGRSAPRRGPLVGDFVREEAERWFPLVRRSLGLDAFVAMGHSVGGGMALHCAAAFPEACRALVTESAQAFVEERTLAGIREAERAFQDPRQLERLARYHGDRAGWVLRAWIDSWLAPGFAGWSLDAAASTVACPALLIHGEEDEFGSVEHPRRLARHLAGSVDVQVLPGLRHLPHREQEGRVVGLVAAFLARVG